MISARGGGARSRVAGKLAGRGADRKPAGCRKLASEQARTTAPRGELCYPCSTLDRAGEPATKQTRGGFMARITRGRGIHSFGEPVPRRRFLQLAGAGAALAVTRPARAETWPSQSIRFVVGFPPGGGADIVSRIMAAWLSQRLGQQVFVENKPGASTNLSLQTVANAPPDGHTIVFIAASAVVNVSLFAKQSADVRDITPVAGLVDFPLVLLANPAFPPKTVAEVIAYAKANPGKVSIGSFGTGTTWQGSA